MSKRSIYRGSGARRSQKKVRPLVATAAAIGGAGLVLAAPAAALLANPGQAQAAPVIPAPQEPITDLFGSVVGSAGLAGCPDVDPMCNSPLSVENILNLGPGASATNLADLFGQASAFPFPPPWSPALPIEFGFADPSWMWPVQSLS